MEQIVSRADLAANDPQTPSPQPTLVHLQEFDFVHREEQITIEDDANEFAFQLFAPAAGRGIVNIRLDSPDITDAEPGLLNANRDSRYYFSGNPTAEEQENFEAAAVSGQDVLSQSKSPWPGMAYPWKVLRVSSTKRQKRTLVPSNALFAELVGKTGGGRIGIPKRVRPGKKARIALRIKTAADKVKQEEQQTKEAREREKRTRRNREKQLKKRLREKAKKAEQGGDGDDDAAREEAASNEAGSQE